MPPGQSARRCYAQVEGKPKVRYKILGLAYVTGWKDGYFTLSSTPGGISTVLASKEREESTAGTFDAHDSTDGREKTLASIVRRRGQPAFRQALLEAYGGHCAISGCSVTDVLEAAHIMPYNGPHTNHTCNGLLLRADLHTLFDLGKLAIDTSGFTVVFSPDLAGSEYDALAGAKVRMPQVPSLWPSKAALERHRAEAGL